MDKLSPANVGMDELPEGFSAVNPNGGGPGGNGGEPNFKNQAQLEQKQMILEQALDSQALARLGRIRMVKPEKAASVENAIISMAMQGKLPGKINEAKLVEILERRSRQAAGASESSSSGIQIQRKRYSLDSDDDEDDDDDV
jgi:programmed cell death protein 5